MVSYFTDLDATALPPGAACLVVAVSLFLAPFRGRPAGRAALPGPVRLALAFVLLAAALIGRPAGNVGTPPPPRRLEAAVYLPLADNRGRPFSEAAWHEAVKGLVVPFGGATLGQAQEGCWVDARQRLCREPVRPVVVSFAPERLDEFRRAAHDVGRRLGQEAVYVRFEEPRVELIRVSAPHNAAR